MNLFSFWILHYFCNQGNEWHDDYPWNTKLVDIKGSQLGDKVEIEQHLHDSDQVKERLTRVKAFEIKNYRLIHRRKDRRHSKQYHHTQIA